ncbi:MAG: nitrous oxide-stimulated promoter family protein [Aliivibrio sp.]|uniref:nitrous oxide-stimulated promoter family protein n=1 Tax=Aliivibrio sp. TaxID=1872443 RepID=UPI001A4970FF|nr:nitrous oxide-stimulated promoter family protein [Aliivibrio sp.]
MNNSNQNNNRVQFELETVDMTISLYCGRLHRYRGAKLCAHCLEIKEYVAERIVNCKKSGEKPSCSDCKEKCYSNSKRLEIQHIYLWSKPKIKWRHPIFYLKMKLGRFIRSDSATTLPESSMQK